MDVSSKTLTSRQIGLGTFPFSNVFSPVSQSDALEIAKTFIDGGGRYIETAPIYPRTVDLGAILRQFPRDSFFVGTKCVLHVDSNGETVSSGTPESLRSQCISEISRLGLDYLDLLQTHVTPTDVSPNVAASALAELKSEGLVRYIGVSNTTASDLRSYLQGAKIDFVQNRYSVIYRAPTDAVTEICRENNIRLNPYQVIERGQLINRNPNAGQWRDGDLRNNKAEYIGDAFDRVHRWAIDELARIADNSGMTLEELCIRWVFSSPQSTLPVVGATKVWQVENNMAFSTEPLSVDILDAMNSAYSYFAKEIRQHFGVSLEEFRGLA